MPACWDCSAALVRMRASTGARDPSYLVHQQGPELARPWRPWRPWLPHGGDYRRRCTGLEFLARAKG